MASLLKVGCLAIVLLSALLVSATATITTVELVDASSSSINLNYDSQTESYADSSVANPNAFVKICADNSADLLNKFVGLCYKVGNEKLFLHVLPAQITNLDSNNCTTLDVDLSFLSARYPGNLTLVLSQTSDLSNPNFEVFSIPAYLNGSFILLYTKGSGKISATLLEARDQSGSKINYVGNYILLGLLNSAQNVEDVKRLSPGQSTDLSWSGDPNFSFSINGLRFVQGSPNVIYCGDGVCSAPYENSQSCPEDCAPPQPTGAVFGYSPPFECKWLSIYDGEARPDKPITLLYSHDCTPIRDVKIELSAPVINARILTVGNESNIPEIKPYGVVFGYFSFEHNIPKEKIAKVTIQFKLPKSALSAKNMSVDDVKLERYQPQAKTWIELPTKFVSEDTQYYYFEAASDSLSTFAIVAYKPVTAPAPTPAPKPEVPKEEVRVQPPPQPAKIPFIQATFILLVTILILIGVGFYLHKRGAAVAVEKVAPAPITRPEIPAVEEKKVFVPKPEERVPVTPAPSVTLQSLKELEQRLAKIKQEMQSKTEAQEAPEFTKKEEVKLKKPKVKRAKVKKAKAKKLK